jgi:hypothetical protein
VQIAVDAEHHLIVAHEVTNQGYDRHQLAPMAFKAQQATGCCEQITALADRGYFNGDQVLSCEGTGVAPVMPKTLTSSGAKRGFFTRQDFIYDAEHDHYTCPAGAKLTKAKRRADHTEDFDFYRHLSACFTCPLKSRCTPTKLRRIKRCWASHLIHLIHVEWQQLDGEPSFNSVPQVAAMRRFRTLAERGCRWAADLIADLQGGEHIIGDAPHPDLCWHRPRRSGRPQKRPSFRSRSMFFAASPALSTISACEGWRRPSSTSSKMRAFNNPANTWAAARLSRTLQPSRFAHRSR